MESKENKTSKKTAKSTVVKKVAETQKIEAKNSVKSLGKTNKKEVTKSSEKAGTNLQKATPKKASEAVTKKDVGLVSKKSTTVASPVKNAKKSPVASKVANTTKQSLKTDSTKINKNSKEKHGINNQNSALKIVLEKPAEDEKNYNVNILESSANLIDNNSTNNAKNNIQNNQNSVTENGKKEKDNNKIKVLYVVSECHPFCATGGLADVAEGLPKFINKNSNIDMRVVLPLYSDIPTEYRNDFKFLGYKYVPVAWRNVYCGVFTYNLNNVSYYFLDNEYYFKRGGGIYSYYDDGERFAFTSRAVLELISLMDFTPDIIHCNDWQSALIPIYLKTIYVNNPNFNKIKTVFTLHNTEYQGKFDLNIISDLFGIDARYKGLLEYNKDLNLVKGAICCCDKFTTVSPTYAQEILSPEHSNGLDSILKQNSFKIRGILNAIDCEFYNPETDKVLYKNYNLNTIDFKCENKLAIQKELGLEINKDIPMMCIVTRMAKHKGLDLIKYCMEGIVANRPVQFVAVGGGDREYEDYFRYLQSKYPSKVKALLGYSNTWGRKAYGASDIFIMPSKSEPCGLSQMVASRYGVVPIVRETGGLKDSMWDFGCEGGGNAYTFHNYNTDDLVYSITRALNDYSNKEDWRNKIKICMSRDFSWKVSANDYILMYNELSN